MWRVALLLWIGLVLGLLHLSAHAAEKSPSGLVAAGPPPAGAQVVTVGFYPITTYELDMRSNTFFARAYVWLRWKGDVDPTKTLEFVNAVQEWDFLKEKLYDEPKVLEDGTFYQIMRVEGRFFQSFSMEDFPLDQQKLSILVEDATNQAEVVSYVLDDKDSGLSDLLDTPGWTISGWTGGSYLHRYRTNFGEDVKPGEHASAYSAIRFDVHIVRPPSYFIWKLFLPLVIVLCAAWVALLIKPTLIEVRTAMPATSLLTTVFLQQSYSSELPEVGHLVLLDKIYVVAYLLIVVTLVRVIVNKLDDDSDQAQIQQVRRYDRVILGVQAVIFFAVSAWMVYAR